MKPKRRANDDGLLIVNCWDAYFPTASPYASGHAEKLAAPTRRQPPRSYTSPGADPMTLLTTEEVARILKKTKWAVCSYVRAGKLHATRVGHEFRFTPEMLEKFVNMHRVR